MACAWPFSLHATFLLSSAPRLLFPDVPFLVASFFPSSFAYFILLRLPFSSPFPSSYFPSLCHPFPMSFSLSFLFLLILSFCFFFSFFFIVLSFSSAPLLINIFPYPTFLLSFIPPRLPFPFILFLLLLLFLFSTATVIAYFSPPPTFFSSVALSSSLSICSFPPPQSSFTVFFFFSFSLSASSAALLVLVFASLSFPFHVSLGCCLFLVYLYPSFIFFSAFIFFFLPFLSLLVLAHSLAPPLCICGA